MVIALFAIFIHVAIAIGAEDLGVAVNWQVNTYVAAAVPGLSLLSFGYHAALGKSGHYMEIDNHSTSTEKYTGRCIMSLVLCVVYMCFQNELIAINAVPKTYFNLSYGYGCAAAFILLVGLYFVFKILFKKGWEERRLRNEKERLWSIVTAITCTEKNPLNDNLISQLNSLEQSLKESSDYVQVQKTVVAVRQLAGALDFMDEVLKPKNNS